jgi:hypothetical protein
MKKLIKICLMYFLTTGISLAVTVSFDENGNGNWSDGQNSGTLGIVGMTDEIVIYTLSPPNPEDQFFGHGEVKIFEDESKTILSDYLLFGSNQIVSGFVYVYSAIEGIPLVSPSYENTVELIEEKTVDGWCGVHYTPGVSDPGYFFGNGVTYIFTSNVPEPATLLLLVFGAVMLRRKF